MTLNLKIFKQNILSKLRRSSLKLNKDDYNNYINSEYSQSRLTHDINDQFYYYDANYSMNGYHVLSDYNRTRNR